MTKDEVAGNLLRTLISEVHDIAIKGVINFIDQRTNSGEHRLEATLSSTEDRKIFVAQLACEELMHALLILLGCDENIKILLRDGDSDGDWFDLREVWNGEELAANYLGKEGWLDEHSAFPTISALRDAPDAYGRKMTAALHGWRNRKPPKPIA